MRGWLLVLALSLWGCQDRGPDGADLATHHVYVHIIEGQENSFGVGLGSVPHPPFGSTEYRLAPTQHFQLNGQSPGPITPAGVYEVQWKDDARRQQGVFRVPSIRRATEFSLTRDETGLSLVWSPHSIPGEKIGFHLREDATPVEGAAYVARQVETDDSGRAALPDGIPGGMRLQGYFERIAYHRGLGGLRNSLIKVHWRQPVDLPVPPAPL